MEIRLLDNVSTLTKAIDAFGKNQIPFAAMRTLNEVAKQTRARVIDRTWPGDVTVRNTRFMRASMMTISRKSNNMATKTNLSVTIGNHPPGNKMHRDYLQRLAIGGTKRPRGRTLAIPGRDGHLRTRTSGGVTKADRPRQILNRKNVFRIDTHKGRDLIVRRATKARYPLQILYLMEPDATVRKQFDFYHDANSTARRAMKTEFEKQFKAAKRSSKRR